mmetsp:Transcript_789/g.1692  ORF Transcript_789/g.1692 Transcript_789/m.1692 type:complete len:715 (+) Transcript_789:50-2194(+)
MKKDTPNAPPPEAQAASGRRIVVSGLSKVRVKRYQTSTGESGIVEEDDLGYFFWNLGCKVESVQLVLDTRSDKSRGFGFINFEDAESVDKALAQSGAEGSKLTPPGGKLNVEVARPAVPAAEQKRRQLLQARAKTEEMERTLRMRQAHVQELTCELERMRARHHQLVEQTSVEAEIEREKQHQHAIMKTNAEMDRTQAALRAAIKEEEQRMRNLEETMCKVDGEQTRRHAEVDIAPEPSFHLEDKAAAGAKASAAAAGTSSSSAAKASDPEEAAQAAAAAGEDHHYAVDEPTEVAAEDMERNHANFPLFVKNTFITVQVPKMDGLHRTQTTPDCWRPGPGSDEEDEDEEDAGEGSQPPPWMQQQSEARDRAQSKANAAVATAVLKEKMGGRPASDELASIAAATASERETTAHRRWADMDEASPIGSEWRAPLSRREIRFRNVPVAPIEQLKEQLVLALERLWHMVRNLPPPLIDEVRVSEAQSDEVSYAARLKGTEAIVTFASADDAAWLIDARLSGVFPRSVLSLGSRQLDVEWVTPPASTDWRKLRYQADTDASSQLTYCTTGTRQSFSSAIGKHHEGGRAAAGSSASGGDMSAQGPARNRTVFLEGIPTSWHVQKVQDEVINMLKELWRKDGLKFDPVSKLHSPGSDRGIAVHPPRRGQGENAGTCHVRLREHLDAKWIIEGAGNRLILNGHKLRASWAKPRLPANAVAS